MNDMANFILHIFHHSLRKPNRWITAQYHGMITITDIQEHFSEKLREWDLWTC